MISSEGPISSATWIHRAILWAISTVTLKKEKEKKRKEKGFTLSLQVYDNDITYLEQVPSHSHSAPTDCYNSGIVFHFKCNQKQAQCLETQLCVTI